MCSKAKNNKLYDGEGVTPGFTAEQLGTRERERHDTLLNVAYSQMNHHDRVGC